MATSVYQTYQDLYEAVIKDAKESTSVTAVVDLVKRWINEGYEAINQRQRRPYLDKTFALTMNAKQDVTASVTQASTTITLSSAVSFTDSTNAIFGFHVSGTDEFYEISSISSATVTLTASYKASTNSAAGGAIYQIGTYLNSEVREVYQARHDIHRFELENKGPNALRQDIMYNPGIYDYPTKFSVTGPDASSSSKRKLLFYPYPNTLHTLYVETNIFPAELSAASDEPMLPLTYRAALYWYGLSKLYGTYHRNTEQGGNAMAMFQEWLKRIDGDSEVSEDYGRLLIDYRRPRRFTKGFGFDSRMRTSPDDE